MEFSRQEYWSEVPFPTSRDLPDLGIKPASPALAGRFFTTSTTWEVQRLAAIQGTFIPNENQNLNAATVNNCLNLGKNRKCGILSCFIPIFSPQMHSGLESQQYHNHSSHGRQKLRSQHGDQNEFRVPPNYHPLKIIIILSV